MDQGAVAVDRDGEKKRAGDEGLHHVRGVDDVRSVRQGALGKNDLCQDGAPSVKQRHLG